MYDTPHCAINSHRQSKAARLHPQRATLRPMADTASLQSFTKDHLEGLRSEIDALLGHAKPATKSTSQTTCWSTNSEDVNVALAVIWAAGSSIHDGVTRFNLVYKANPGEAASESMAREMGGFCQQMVSSLTLLSSVGASKAMVAYFSAGVRAVLHSLKDVIEAILDPTRHSHINSLTGVVWQACKELQQSPKTNKLACRRQMMQWSLAIKDTIDEFQEAAKTAPVADAGRVEALKGAQNTEEVGAQFSGLGLGGDAAEEQEDFDFDDMDEDYSPSELQCVQASIDVLRVFRRCLKAANDSLNALDSDKAHENGSVAVDTKGDGWLKERLQWAQALQACLDEANDCAAEVGVLLYPPLDGSDLSGRANDLERTLTEFCDVFYSNSEGAKLGVGGEQSPLRAVTEEKCGLLKAEVAKL